MHRETSPLALSIKTKNNKNYAMIAIVMCKRLIFRPLSYSIVCKNIAITML